MAFNKGDIQDFDDLDLYSSQAMARNNLDMLTDTATAFERATGEVPRTLMDLASSDRQPAQLKPLKATDTLFVNKLYGKMDWLRLVNSERVLVRKDVSHKLAAAKNKRTTSTEFDMCINDMVSYRGAAVKVIELLHSSKHGYAKAVVRTVTHDNESIDTVNFSDLTPLAMVDARPELMVRCALGMQKGRLVFLEDEVRILLEIIIDVDGVELQVHSTVQANKKENRFVPLYATDKGKNVPKEHPPEKDKPVVQCVAQSQVVATAPIEKFLVPKSALAALRSRGVIMSPLMVDIDHHWHQE